jgi:hypothetical protein
LIQEDVLDNFNAQGLEWSWLSVGTVIRSSGRQDDGQNGSALSNRERVNKNK